MKEISRHFANRSPLRVVCAGHTGAPQGAEAVPKALPGATAAPGVAVTHHPLHGKREMHKGKRRECCQTWA